MYTVRTVLKEKPIFKVDDMQVTLTSSTSADTMSSCSSSLPLTGWDWLLRRGWGFRMM